MIYKLDLPCIAWDNYIKEIIKAENLTWESGYDIIKEILEEYCSCDRITINLNNGFISYITFESEEDLLFFKIKYS